MDTVSFGAAHGGTAAAAAAITRPPRRKRRDIKINFRTIVYSCIIGRKQPPRSTPCQHRPKPHNEKHTNSIACREVLCSVIAQAAHGIVEKLEQYVAEGLAEEEGRNVTERTKPGKTSIKKTQRMNSIQASPTSLPLPFPSVRSLLDPFMNLYPSPGPVSCGSDARMLSVAPRGHFTRLLPYIPPNDRCR